MLAQSQDSPETRRRKMYYRGATPIFACRADPRFSYCLYVPHSFDADPAGSHAGRGHARLRTDDGGLSRPLRVRSRSTRNAWSWRRSFPIGPLGDGNAHGFKVLKEGTLRYDTVLLSMIEEAGAMLQASFGKFMLFGYSGGGHFVHRFFYLHPERLHAVSIGRRAP